MAAAIRAVARLAAIALACVSVHAAGHRPTSLAQSTYNVSIADDTVLLTLARLLLLFTSYFEQIRN